MSEIGILFFDVKWPEGSLPRISANEASRMSPEAALCVGAFQNCPSTNRVKSESDPDPFENGRLREHMQ